MMSRRTALALALGWFVVTDILLTTTSASAVNTLNSIGISFRGILRSLISNYQISYFGFTILIIILICSILLITFLLRAWLNTIKLTRVLVSFFLDEKNTSQDPSAREAFMLASLFGNNIMKSRNALVWQLLYSLLITWLLLLIITVLTGLITTVTTY